MKVRIDHILSYTNRPLTIFWLLLLSFIIPFFCCVGDSGIGGLAIKSALLVFRGGIGIIICGGTFEAFLFAALMISL